MIESQTQDTTKQKVAKRPLLKRPKTVFEELLKSDISPTLPKVGEIIIGKVLAKEGSRLYIDLGATRTGIVYGVEFYNAKDTIKELGLGDQITAKVVDLENDENYIELSIAGSIKDLGWKRLRELQESKKVMPVKIEAANKGGLLATLEDQAAFLPVSQLTTEHYPRVEEGDKEKILEELKKLVGEEFKVVVIDIDPKEDKLIISEKEAQNDKLQEILDQYKVGDIIDGEISGVVDFGAFIKFQPVREQPSAKDPLPQQSEASETRHERQAKQPTDTDKEAMDMEGLVHISELDWQLIGHPRDVVAVGQKVKAKIISINDGRISLSLKALKENPWANVLDKYKPGQIIEGSLMKFNPFGAFIHLDEEIHGLVHISEFGSEENMQQAIQPNKTYKFKIVSIEPSEYRMALSLYKEGEEETKKEEVKKEEQSQ